MDVGKGSAVRQQQALEGLFGRLLGIEAEIFEVDVGMLSACQARLPRARFSHSRGSSGANRSGGVDHSPLFQGWMDDEGGGASVAFDVLRGDDDHVDGAPDPAEAPVDRHRKPPAVCTRSDDQ